MRSIHYNGITRIIDRNNHLLKELTLKRTKMNRIIRIMKVKHKRTELNVKIGVFVVAVIIVPLIASLIYRLIDLGEMTKYYF